MKTDETSKEIKVNLKKKSKRVENYSKWKIKTYLNITLNDLDRLKRQN